MREVPHMIAIFARIRSEDDVYAFGSRDVRLRIRDLKIRVNNKSLAIPVGEPDQILYEWYRRNGSRALSFEEWSENPIVLLSPTELCMEEFRESRAVISTFECNAIVDLNRRAVKMIKSFTNPLVQATQGLSKFNTLARVTAGTQLDSSNDLKLDGAEYLISAGSVLKIEDGEEWVRVTTKTNNTDYKIARGVRGTPVSIPAGKAVHVVTGPVNLETSGVAVELVACLIYKNHNTVVTADESIPIVSKNLVAVESSGMKGGAMNTTSAEF